LWFVAHYRQLRNTVEEVGRPIDDLDYVITKSTDQAEKYDVIDLFYFIYVYISMLPKVTNYFYFYLFK